MEREDLEILFRLKDHSLSRNGTYYRQFFDSFVEMEKDFNFLEKELNEGHKYKELVQLIVSKEVDVYLVNRTSSVEEYNEEVESWRKLWDYEYDMIKGECPDD